MSEHEQIEGLHQSAAESYLQGQFQEALDSWRELLTLDPKDERAVEGIRLCELIVQQASDLGFAGEEDDIMPVAPAVEPGEGSDVDFDEIASIFGSSDEARPEAPPEVQAETKDDPAWDLSGLEEGSTQGEAPAAPATPDPTADAGSVPDSTEVQTRIADFLSQASTSYDAGDLEGAMTLLDRVFGLEPDNAAAQALGQAFRADMDSRQDAAPPPPPPSSEPPQSTAGQGPVADAVADEGLKSLGVAAPGEEVETGAIDTGFDPDFDDELADDLLVPAPPEVGGVEDLLGDVDDTPLEAPEAPAAAPKAAAAPRDRRKMLLMGIGAVAALAAAGFLGLKISGADDVVPTVPPGAAKARPAGSTNDTPAEPDSAPEEVAAAPVAETAPQTVEVIPPTGNLESVLTRGNVAFEAGEFSRAVVAFNQALQLDPNSAVAKQGLSMAAGAYQEQRDFMDKLNSATESFEQGDYRAALRVFYRLPGTEESAQFARFKANSWYNLGIGALQTGSCNDARSHLAEATALAPADAGVATASRLAAGCTTTQSDVTWYSDVQALQSRKLED